MTKQDITEIIKNNITTQLQKPEAAVVEIARAYGDWLRGVVKRAQDKAVLSAQAQQSEGQGAQTQAQSAGGQ